MPGRKAVILGIMALLMLGLWALPAQQPSPPSSAPKLDPRDILGDTDNSGFARALSPRRFEFPQDHAAHPDYRHEWWYLTGNLRDPLGRRFGYQFTLFRFALDSGEFTGVSAWRTRQLYMGHLAVTDVATGRFLTAQRFARGALGLAGAEADPLHIWLEDWSLRGERERSRWRVGAATHEVALQLSLIPLKQLVLQGEDGLSRKGAEPGNASYYYSLTRLRTEGEIRVGAEVFTVEGLSWLDREWGTSALGADVVGWDWFALQLQDGRELMLYHLRRADGTPDAHSAGVLVDAQGGATPLALDARSITVTRTWRSPRTAITYPAGWRLRLPEHGLDLDVRPLVNTQEWDGAVRYWEGAVAVRGSAGDRAIEGSGYVELTGYGGEEKEH